MSEKPSFFSELKRRNVYKVAVAYIVAGWALSQGIAQVLPVFDIPNWVVRVLVLLIVTGFPIALVIAWAFEATPEGIKRTAVADAASERSRGKVWIYVVIVGALLSIGLFFLGRYTAGNATPRHDAIGRTEAAKAIPQKSIAVLPLLNESGDPADEYFSDGLSEELIAALGQIRNLKVIGRSSSFRFKDRKEEPKTIGEKLGVSTLLEGTVRKQGDKVRIVAELINAADGTELWSRIFDRELKDIFAVQTEIAQAVAASLELTLLGQRYNRRQRVDAKVWKRTTRICRAIFISCVEMWKIIGRRSSSSMRRFDLILITLWLLPSALKPGLHRRFERRAKERGLGCGEKGRRESGRGWSQSRRGACGFGLGSLFCEWKFAEGLAELKRARELAPANPTANDLLARVLIYVNQMAEAEKLARQATELDPLAYLARGNLARDPPRRRKTRRGRCRARKAAELQPAAAGNHRWQVIVAVLRGDGDTALREAELEPNEGYRRFELALAHYARGDRAAADKALADMVANDRNLLAYQIAEVYAWRGETDKAFEWLQISYDNHDTGMLSLLIDPLMRGLRSDPRYKIMVEKVGLPTPL